MLNAGAPLAYHPSARVACRADTTMKMRIIICLVASLALLASPQRTGAAERLSARIHALGGECVSGVIPDLYTDIGIDPAYAHLVERPTLIWGYRYAEGFNPVFPYMRPDRGYDFDLNKNMVNELSARGLALSAWRLALTAQWKLIDSGESYSETRIGTRYGAYQTLYQDLYDRANDYWSVDLAGARELGEHHSLGIRVAGSGAYYRNNNAYKRTQMDYEENNFFDLEREYTDNSWRSVTGRSRSLGLQAGLARSRDGKIASEIVLEASLEHVDHRYQILSQNIEIYYDIFQNIDDYSYYDSRWSDARKGNLWKYALTLRHTFPRGIRVFARGSFSTSRYDASYGDTREGYEWDYSSALDEVFSSSFTGDGTLRGGAFVLKAGKRFDLRETLAFHVGFKGDFARTRSTEKPLINFRLTSEGSDGAGEVVYDVPSRLEYTGTAGGIAFPVSLEFEPSSWFSYFAGITFYGTWEKRSTGRTVPSAFEYFGPAVEAVSERVTSAPARPGAIVVPDGYLEEAVTRYGSGQTVSLGFSLHYGERLSIDVYTGSEIIPSNVEYCTLDARYRF